MSAAMDSLNIYDPEDFVIGPSVDEEDYLAIRAGNNQGAVPGKNRPKLIHNHSHREKKDTRREKAFAYHESDLSESDLCGLRSKL